MERTRITYPSPEPIPEYRAALVALIDELDIRNQDVSSVTIPSGKIAEIEARCDDKPVWNVTYAQLKTTLALYGYLPTDPQSSHEHYVRPAETLSLPVIESCLVHFLSLHAKGERIDPDTSIVIAQGMTSYTLKRDTVHWLLLLGGWTKNHENNKWEPTEVNSPNEALFQQVVRCALLPTGFFREEVIGVERIDTKGKRSIRGHSQQVNPTKTITQLVMMPYDDSLLSTGSMNSEDRLFDLDKSGPLAAAIRDNLRVAKIEISGMEELIALLTKIGFTPGNQLRAQDQRTIHTHFLGNRLPQNPDSRYEIYSRTR